MPDKGYVHAHCGGYVHAHSAGYAYADTNEHTLSTDGVRSPLSNSNTRGPGSYEHADADTLPGDNHRDAHLYANTYTDANTDYHAVPNKRVSNFDT